MKLAIHHTKGSFSERWINYCRDNAVPYTLVDCYRNDIIEQLKDCDALLWHWHHGDYKAVRFARQLTYSLEAAGIKVFPDSKTAWHFDDKVGQKYLAEALQMPLVPSYVFYSKEEAHVWANTTTYPKVFKLRGGAGASNVKLVRSASDADRLINKAFGRGFAARDRFNRFRDALWRLKRDRNRAAFFGLFKGIGRIFLPTVYENMQGREKGYVYFQEFMPDNNYDTRIIVINGKAFAIRRYNREGDFRASGSGLIGFDKKLFDERMVRISFDLANKMQAQSLALDFIYDQQQQPLIVEMSYGFMMPVYDPCTGYWDQQLNWHEGAFNPQQFMVEGLIDQIVQQKPAFS
ncbi:RimK family alpha-L-glutamate ligase [Chitinophaga sp. Hz27]|uniref:ATP-grasp domain-containing protein n=1 Tax=Chitinophaga sp. Hz27 TaxID=3347169 RepID=UPI0035DC0B1A